MNLVRAGGDHVRTVRNRQAAEARMAAVPFAADREFAAREIGQDMRRDATFAERSLVTGMSIAQVKELIEDGTVRDGMLPKVLTCISALEKGVKSAHIIDGRIKHSILLEIFTKDGIGTMITP